MEGILAPICGGGGELPDMDGYETIGISYIYVSFGSIAVKSEQQLEQLALGLEGSEQPFLWVLWLDISEGQAMVLPDGFEAQTKDRALFVRWMPQSKVLAHASVGLFVTHRGWNSTLESMSIATQLP
jgi:UDP:flavonoid glycosyltransferase YjiC (YdhE family)